MTKEECIKSIVDGVIPSECVTTSPSLFNLNSIESIFSILSAMAVIFTAFIIWNQLKHLKIQVTQGKNGAIEQITATRDTAIQQIDAGRTNTKLNATLNLLAQVQTNPQWFENRRKFIAIKESKKIREHALGKSDAAICVRQQLNQYELFALGIFYEIIDEGMYRRYYRGTIISDWTECSPFIHEERSKNKRAWIELEKLVERFKDHEEEE